MKKIRLLDYGYDDIAELSAMIKTKGFDVEIQPRDTKAADITADKVSAVMLCGGPYTVFEDDIQVVDADLFNLPIPLLGLGRGMQVMIDCLGGVVTPAGYQYAPTPSKLTVHNSQTGIFAGFNSQLVKPLGFDAKVSKLPEGFQVLASGNEIESGDNRPFGAIEYPERRLYGIQYVFEAHNQADDEKALDNFLDLFA